MSVGGDLVVFQFLGSLKDTRTSNFCSNDPSYEILGPLGRYDHLWKKTTANKPASMIFLLAKKKYKIQRFCREELETPFSRDNSYAESDGVIFIKILWLLEGIPPFFRK